VSVEMEIRVEGFPELEAKLEKLDGGMESKVSEAMVSEAEAMKTTAQQLCPVRTGYLRSTIFARFQGWMLKLGASAPYAIYQEFGTKFVQARHFLGQAVELGMQSLIDRINLAIDGAAREAST